ncbi:MAG TPA: SDR family NAD(P)-dependent oxidoreductase [Ohtaekwangia sp.]|uniref:SDR family NAD(P)-dependent oxidoreductase n=1 Tax=Ohtaekwangia sp. TaxID=2066019 RepID=UPI002F92A2DB
MQSVSSRSKTVLILGANSDVAKEAMAQYISEGYHVIAASRSVEQLKEFIVTRKLPISQVDVGYFDATAFETHADFYRTLPVKPHIVVYAAGFLKNNEEALVNWEGAFQMMKVHYCGAVSILNIVAMDKENHHLERIVGLSSLSGVRGRKSNFIYGSTKSAFTQYLAGMRQYLFARGVAVNVIVAGYIRSKMTAGLDLPESLMLEPEFIAKSVVKPGSSFVIVPGFKWKIIYHILRLLPEKLVAKLP